MSVIHINIGSNQGNRALFIECAVAALRSMFAAMGGTVCCSRPVESEPWGYESANTFVNVGAIVETPMKVDPMAVLAMLREAERGIDPSPHRNESGGYVDRRIDIDLIDIDGVTMHTPALTLPHPRMHLRRFVLEPLAQLCPGWRHPLLGKSVDELLGELE